MPSPAFSCSCDLRQGATDLLLVVGLATSVACSSDRAVDPSTATPSRAFGIWKPGPNDTCTKEQHDAYAVVGPDGKLYPTWHPPTGPGGCTFGHEHGRDPHGSKLYDEGEGLPFGLANEALAISDPVNPRDEDHVGHKVEWENGVELQFSGPASAIFTGTCDVLTKLHQGTHSKDAFTNNLHELAPISRWSFPAGTTTRASRRSWAGRSMPAMRSPRAASARPAGLATNRPEAGRSPG